MEPPAKHTIDTEDPAPVPLDLGLPLAEFIILKARAFDVKVPMTDPDEGSNATDDNNLDVLEDDPNDLTQTELRDTISTLSDDAAADLVALVWLGRGDYSAAEWKQARGLAIEQMPPDLAAYLMGEPNLGDFIEEGLNMLGYRPEDYALD